LNDNYGSKDAPPERKVKERYQELQPERHNEEYDAKAVQDLQDLIEIVDGGTHLMRLAWTGGWMNIAGPAP
jgi:Tfp pilus assembly protein PilN